MNKIITATLVTAALLVGGTPAVAGAGSLIEDLYDDLNTAQTRIDCLEVQNRNLRKEARALRLGDTGGREWVAVGGPVSCTR